MVADEAFQREVLENLKLINTKLNKQAGFISGVMFVFTGIIGLIGLVLKIKFGD